MLFENNNYDFDILSLAGFNFDNMPKRFDETDKLVSTKEGFLRGNMFKKELRDTKNIVYIQGGPEKIEKAKTKHIPLFTSHFKNVGIEFEFTKY